jgi:hypothetical protein
MHTVVLCQTWKSAEPISTMALEAIRRIDALFDIEREINGVADVLARGGDTPITGLEQLLPWSWTPSNFGAQAA